MRRGLVFGKFMPLHRGHQLLIETALSRVDELTVVVYDTMPDYADPPMPVELRCRWLAELYPQLAAIVPMPDEWADADTSFASAYAEQLEFLGRFDAMFSSEEHYAAFASLVADEHVVVDEARTLVPTSGTAIREDLYANRGWLDPSVYASLVRKVVFVGTESTGKTTLARELAARHGTLWTHEYGRELWVAQGGGTFHDHLGMARTQLRREEAARRHARRFLFCDTNAWTTLQWSLFVYGTADPRLAELAASTAADYEWFLCSDDIPFEDDGVRELTGGRAHEFQVGQAWELAHLGVPFHVLEGPLEQRAARVEDVLGLSVRAAA